MIHAIVPLFGQAVHQWVGPDHLLNLLLPKLSDIRELQSILVVSDRPEEAQVAVECAPEVPLHWHKLAQPVRPLPELCRQLMAVEASAALLPEATVLLAVDPGYPFLDREKIEAVLYSACRDPKECRTAFTTTGMWRLAGSSLDPSLLNEPAYVDACVALPACPEGFLRLLAPTAGLPLTVIEAIDVHSEEGQRLANAVILGMV